MLYEVITGEGQPTSEVPPSCLAPWMKRVILWASKTNSTIHAKEEQYELFALSRTHGARPFLGFLGQLPRTVVHRVAVCQLRADRNNFV